MLRPKPLVAVAVSLWCSSAVAQPRWPFEFDVNVGVDPAGLKTEIAAGNARLPLLDTSTLAPHQSAAVTLWMWPEVDRLMTSASAAGPSAMPWPDGTGCAAHAAFALSLNVASGAPASCSDALANVREALLEREACREVAEPERFVLGAKPAAVDLASTSSLEGLVGLCGEALSHHPLPTGLVAPQFVDTLRTVLLKIRAARLLQRIDEAEGRYTSASLSLDQKSACFDGAALASAKAKLATLTTELAGARARLAKVEADGVSARTSEERCLAARGRTRKGPLPFPSLTREERLFVAFWLGGIYWRMRGGGLIPLGSTQQARFFFLQQPFARIGELSGTTDGADAAFQLYLAVFEGWGQSMDMGTTPGGGDKYADLVGMTGRGERQVKAAAQLLQSRGYDPRALQAGGLQMGPCYFRAFEELPAFRYAPNATTPYGPFIEGPTAVGEFCSGASIGVGLTRTLLDGVPSGSPAAPLCVGQQCGDDGCGGSCGVCAAGSSCEQGSCVTPPPAPSPPASTSTVPQPSAPADGGVAVDAAPNGGACACSVPTSHHARRAPWFEGLVLGLAGLWRRRRPGRGA